MGPINNLPLGFLDLLGLRTLGVYPNVTADVIAPTIDITPFIQNAAAEVLQFSDTFAGAGTRNSGVFTFGAAAVVPANEMWLVTHYHLDMLLAGAGTEAGSAHLAWTRNASTNPFFRPPSRTPYGLRTYNALDEMFTGNANGVYIACETSAEPFIIPPGSNVSYLISHLPWTAGAAESIVAYVNLTTIRLRR